MSYPMQDDGHLPLHPLDEALEQGAEADAAVSRNPDKFLHFPWPALDYVVGGIGPGDIWFVGAYSGHGKTTFLMSALDLWFNQGKRVFYLGLESKPSTLRTQWACQRLGINAGDVLSGKSAARADWPFMRKRIVAEIEAQSLDDRSSRVYFSPEKFVNADKLCLAIEQAAEMESDVLIIDHVDHLEGTGSLYNASVEMHKLMLATAQKYGVRILAATQFNNEMIRGDRSGMHKAPTPTAVYQGGHKRQIASGMLGLYKPFRFNLTSQELTDFSKGRLEPQEVVEPNTMAVSVMKHRLFGQREGKRVFLRVEQGKVTNFEMPDGSAFSPLPRGN